MSYNYVKACITSI